MLFVVVCCWLLMSVVCVCFFLVAGWCLLVYVRCCVMAVADYCCCMVCDVFVGAAGCRLFCLFKHVACWFVVPVVISCAGAR